MLAAPILNHKVKLTLAYLLQEYSHLNGEEYSSEQFAQYMLWRLTRASVDEIEIVHTIAEFNDRFADLQIVESAYPTRVGEGVNAGIYSLYYRFVKPY